MGTPAYALATLRLLAEKTELVAVFSRPDAISRRGNKTIPSPVSSLALELGVELFRPKTLRDPEVIASIKALKPELIVVAAYGAILPKEVLDIPARGCLNLHASLLPKWRGAAPIQRAILAGDEETGVALMQMEEGLDTGAFSFVARTPIVDKTSEELTLELGELGAGLLDAYLSSEEYDVVWQMQDEDEVSYAHKIEDSDVALQPADSSELMSAKVRASSDSAPAMLNLVSGELVHKIRVLDLKKFDAASSMYAEKLSSLEADARKLGDQGSSDAGEENQPIDSFGHVFIAKKVFLIKSSDGWLELLKVKPEAKKEMTALDFARGARISGSALWTQA